MRKTLLLAFLFFTIMSNAQKPCAAPEYRQFDFWIGEWEAFSPKGQKAGDSKISLLLDSCVILEEWTSASIQKGIRFAGKSFNSYNSSKKRWQQYWLDNTGSVTEYLNGEFSPGKMILATDNIKVNDTTWVIQRMTFYQLGPDKVRQHGENSNDGGKTWKTTFDLEYRRKK
jgi:hypothetical protein